MTLRYVRNGDGYIVHSRERAVCVVHTKTSEYLPLRFGPDGQPLTAEVVDRHLPQSEWQFHFYHGFFTPPMLKELIDLLPKAEPDNGRPAAGAQLRSAEEEANARFYAGLEDNQRAYAGSSPSTLGAIKDVEPPPAAWVPPNEERGCFTGESPPGQDPGAPFVLTPEDEAKRRSMLEHHERVITAPPASADRDANSTPPI